MSLRNGEGQIQLQKEHLHLYASAMVGICVLPLLYVTGAEKTSAEDMHGASSLIAPPASLLSPRRHKTEKWEEPSEFHRGLQLELCFLF